LYPILKENLPVSGRRINRTQSGPGLETDLHNPPGYERRIGTGRVLAVYCDEKVRRDI